MTATSRLRSRRGVLAVVVSVGSVVLLVVAAVMLGSWLRSPEQAAADAAPPKASLITVPVEERALSQPVVLRGRVLAGSSQKILPPASAVGGNSVVTAVPLKKGQSIEEGRVLVAVAGQPVFALRLDFPLYRDLVGGMTGPDVSEVQTALRRLGLAFDAPRLDLSRRAPPTRRTSTTTDRTTQPNAKMISSRDVADAVVAE